MDIIARSSRCQLPITGSAHNAPIAPSGAPASRLAMAQAIATGTGPSLPAFRPNTPGDVRLAMLQDDRGRLLAVLLGKPLGKLLRSLLGCLSGKLMAVRQGCPQQPRRRLSRPPKATPRNCGAGVPNGDSGGPCRGAGRASDEWSRWPSDEPIVGTADGLPGPERYPATGPRRGGFGLQPRANRGAGRHRGFPELGGDAADARANPAEASNRRVASGGWSEP